MTLFAAGAVATATPAAASVPDYAWMPPAQDPHWSAASSWAGGTAPTSNSIAGTVSFAPEAPLSCSEHWCSASNNDVAGLSVGALSITDPRLRLDGNPITLGAGGLHVTYASSNQAALALPLTLGNDQTWTIDRPADRQEYGNFNGFQVQEPVTGAHALNIDLDAAGILFLIGQSEVGPVTVNAPPSRIGSGHNRIFRPQLQVIGGLNAGTGNAITINHTELQATAPLGSVELHDAGLKLMYPGGTSIVSAAGLTMDADSQITINIPRDGTERGADYSSLSATGDVHLAGFVALVAGTVDRCFEPKVGDSYTIVSTKGDLTGTFSGDVDADHESFYPGYQCPSSADRLLEYRYDRTSMPRTVKMVVVPSGDAPGSFAGPTPGPTPVPTPTPQPTLTPAPTPTPAAMQPPIPKATTAEQGGFSFRARTLRIANVPLTPTKGGRCPKYVTIKVSDGRAKVIKRVLTRRSNGSCSVQLTIALTRKLAGASRLKVNIAGKGLRTMTETVQADGTA